MKVALLLTVWVVGMVLGPYLVMAWEVGISPKEAIAGLARSDLLLQDPEAFVQHFTAYYSSMARKAAEDLAWGLSDRVTAKVLEPNPKAYAEEFVFGSKGYLQIILGSGISWVGWTWLIRRAFRFWAL